MNKQQLANKIWASANKMRSKIEANEYKDYILGLIFYKFLSDNEVNYLKSIGWTDEDIVTLVEDHENQEAVMMMEYCRNNIGYFIEYKNLFGTWLKPNSEFSVANLSGALSSFDRLISPHYKHVYENIFKTLQAGLSKLGENPASQTRAIKDLIKLIKDIPTDGRQDYDVLGYVYEYLISNFAANAGKKAGEFYTPHEVAMLMSEIVAEHQSDGEIKPYYDAATKKYEALVPPQNMTGKPLVRISIGSNDFTYTPETEAAGKFDFFGGKRYAYTITVKANGIDVQSVTSGTWVANGEENVTSKKVKQSFTADELKIGDYFYSDGTWSDGGLRKIYTDGSMKIASPKPAPVLQTKSEIERRVIGIVFQTDPSRIGTAEKSKLGEGNVHGLVMALKNTATDIQWSHEENNLEDVKDCWSKSEIYSDISGLHNYTKILDHANSIGGIEAYPAFEAVEKWNDMYSINEYRPPRNTTGWFIPSSGQWWDILQNLGGCPAMADKGQQTSSDSGDFRWLGQGDVPAALNAWMNKIAADSKNDFTTGDRFWSSSELNQFRARNWNVYSSDYVCCDFVYKKWSNAVRPVLAF